MDIEIIFKIAAIGIITSVVCQVLYRAGREDIATLAALSGLVIVLMMVIGMLGEFFVSVREVFGLE